MHSHVGTLCSGTNAIRGDNYVAIYNEAYKALAAHTHPKLMGNTFEGMYPEQWPIFKPYFEHAKKTGTGTVYDTLEPLIVERYGFREEYDCNPSVDSASLYPTTNANQSLFHSQYSTCWPGTANLSRWLLQLPSREN